MTFPTGFQSFIDSTPTPANVLDQQPLVSLIFPGGMGKARVSGLGEPFSEPIHSLVEMLLYIKLHSPEPVLLFAEFWL